MTIIYPEWSLFISRVTYHHRHGIAQGFRIAFQYILHACTSAKSNHPSANEHPDIFSNNLETKKLIAKGHLLGPLPSSINSFIHTSSLGEIPKKHSENMAFDSRSIPLAHHRVNEKPSCSLTYMRDDEVVHKILSLGRGWQLARQVLGLSWKGNMFTDMVLPIGLTSALKIYNDIADALQRMWLFLPRALPQ